jgi:hypothetical protein
LVFNNNSDTNSDFIVKGLTNTNLLFTDASADSVGIRQATPTAQLHIGAGAATAGDAPLKLTTGPLLTTAEIGAFEYLTPILYFTNGDATRLRIPTLQFGYINTTQIRLNTTTYTDIAGMSVSLLAARRYEIEVFVSITAVNGVGAQLRFNYTGTMSSVNTFSHTINVNTIIDSTQTNSSTFAAVEISSAVISAAGFFVKGHIQPSTTGTLTLQGSQATLSAINTTYFEAGGFIKVTPII